MFAVYFLFFFFFKQKTAYEMRISDWSSDACSSDLHIDKDALFRAAVRRAIEAYTVPREAIDAVVSDDLEATLTAIARLRIANQIGRASCRERVCQYV